VKTFEGLSSEEARKRLALYGPNLILKQKSASWLAEAKMLFLDPMGLMLLSLSGIYFFLGETRDAYILLAAFVPVVATDVFLELRAKRALDSLKRNFSPLAKLLRDGRIHSVPVEEIVPGDLMVFEEGQRLAADGEVLDAENLSIDESTLTGESVPVAKAEKMPFFSGTLILAGRGVGLVSATGQKSRLGQIANLIETAETEKSRLQRKIDLFISRLFKVAVLFVIALFSFEYFRTGSLNESLIAALTLGMAAFPEEFPLVFTLYLSLGAWRLSKKGVLVRSLPAIEALGNIEVLCTDKTGTLTKGFFELTKILALTESREEKLMLEALLACESLPVDSLERCIYQKAESTYPSVLQERAEWKMLYDYPFEPHGKHMSHVWEHPVHGALLTMKGAFEGILEHCQASEEERAHASRCVQEYASQGMRVLALATKEGRFTGQREADEENCRLRALLVFTDPVRSEARRAVESCQRSGIDVKMLTGDHMLTAHAVAEEVGLKHDHQYIFSGDQLARLSEDERRTAYLRGNIFARVQPEQKFELIERLRASGKRVAMTGDGVNDAPALRLADIGISMGARASDVARSQSQMVLLKDDFYGLVDALFEGRRIFLNLKKSFSYLLSFHVPIVTLTLVPSLMGWPLMLLPVHIVLLELIVHPISAIVFENMAVGAKDELEARPGENLLSQRDIFMSLLTGLSISLLCLWLFQHFLKVDILYARAFAFYALLVGGLGFVALEALPRGKLWSFRILLHRRFAIAACAILGILVAVNNLSPLQRLFHLRALPNSSLLTILLIVIASLAWRPVYWILQAAEAKTSSSQR
jgi:Ca2+-transporting ATPase